MQPTRQRFSHRHLLALCTFLVPLGVLAMLGQSELRRSGEEAQSALVLAAREYLRSASRAVEREFQELVPKLLERSEAKDMLAKLGPVRTALALRQDQRFSALRDIILLDERGNTVWPTQAPASMNLGVREPGRRSTDSPTSGALDAAELLLVHQEYGKAIILLDRLIARIEAANIP